MIKQADKDKLKKLGIDLEVLIAAHNDTAEKDITLPDGELFTPATLAIRDENTKKEGVKEGEKSALTIAISEINKQGLTIDATKIERFGDLAKVLKTEIDKTGDDKSKQLSTQVTALIADKTKLESEIGTYKSKAETIEFNYQQFKNLPPNRSPLMNESEYLQVMGARGIEIKADGVYKNGQLMTDANTKGAMPHSKAYEAIFAENNWIAQAPAGAQGGRGGGNSGGGAAGGKALSQTEAMNKWVTANPNGNPVSPEAFAFIQNEAKDNPTFNWSV